MDLDGKRVLLTGASSGIGRALAMALAHKGAVLVLAARRQELLDEVAAEVADAGRSSGHGRRNRPVETGRLGGACRTGAGRVRRNRRYRDQQRRRKSDRRTSTDRRFRAARTLFEVNLWSPLALKAALLPSMLDAGHGTIVNVTSTVQAVPLPLLGYYAASKAALAQATRSLRLELAETPVNVMEVVPGSTDTPLSDIGELPWKSAPPPTLPPVSPKSRQPLSFGRSSAAPTVSSTRPTR